MLVTVRWEANAPSWWDDPRGDEALRVVQARADRWAAAVGAFLDLDLPAAVVVSLHAGNRLPMTRHAHVRLPVRPHASTLAGALTTANAGLAHELVHVVAGRSPDPLLNEGLAVYVDSTLRLAGGVWPFYDLAPHRWVQVFVERGGFVPLAELLSSANEAGVNDDSPVAGSRRARFYLEAASWTAYLFETLPRARFWENFRAGALVPTGSDAEAAERAWLACLGGPLTVGERRRCTESFARTDNPRAAPLETTPLDTTPLDTTPLDSASSGARR